MHQLRVGTAQNVSLDLEVAGLGDRLIAGLIDYTVLFAYLIGINLFVGGLVSAMDLDASTGLIAAWVILFLPAALYFLLCEIFLEGQSVGKRYMEIKVLRTDGTPASLGNYVVRWILRLVDLHITFGLGAILTIMFTDSGQRLGDLAAGTTVVRVGGAPSASDVTLAEVDDDYTVTYPEVRRLSDDDVETTREVLDVLKYERRSHENEELGRTLQRALERKMGVSSNDSPREFLATVLQDYTALHRE